MKEEEPAAKLNISPSQPTVFGMQQSLHRLMIETVVGAPHHPETAEVKSYQDRAREEFKNLGREFHALPQEVRDQYTQQLFAQLTSYFLLQEQHERGPDAFQLIDAHNAVVRNFDQPEFHQELMKFLASQEQAAREAGDQPKVTLAVKAHEFDANGRRRRAFNLIEKGKKTDNQEMQEQGAQEVAAVRAVFGEVLHHWEQVQDFTSQARALYELAHIALETKDYRSAADVQAKSALVSEQMGIAVEAVIARIKECEALLKGDLELPAVLRERLRGYVEALRPLAQEKRANAREWLGNGLRHLAEAEEATGDLEAAIRSMSEILENPDVQGSDIGREIGDIARTEIDRLTHLQSTI